TTFEDRGVPRRSERLSADRAPIDDVVRPGREAQHAELDPPPERVLRLLVDQRVTPLVSAPALSDLPRHGVRAVHTIAFGARRAQASATLKNVAPRIVDRHPRSKAAMAVALSGALVACLVAIPGLSSTD